MKKTLNIEKATDEELLAQFSEEEIQMGIEHYNDEYVMIRNLLFYKSIDDVENYLKCMDEFKEYVEFSFDKNLLDRYLLLEKNIFG